MTRHSTRRPRFQRVLGLISAMGLEKSEKMSGLSETVITLWQFIGDSWRFCIGLSATICILFALANLIANSSLQLAVCIPVGVVGLGLSVYWEATAEWRR